MALLQKQLGSKGLFWVTASELQLRRTKPRDLEEIGILRMPLVTRCLECLLWIFKDKVLYYELMKQVTIPLYPLCDNDDDDNDDVDTNRRTPQDVPPSSARPIFKQANWVKWSLLKLLRHRLFPKSHLISWAPITIVLLRNSFAIRP